MMPWNCWNLDACQSHLGTSPWSARAVQWRWLWWILDETCFLLHIILNIFKVSNVSFEKNGTGFPHVGDVGLCPCLILVVGGSRLGFTGEVSFYLSRLNLCRLISWCVVCIHELYVFSHWIATTSAKWNHCNPPSSLVCGPLLTVWSIVCHLLHRHLSVITRSHFLQWM